MVESKRMREIENKARANTDQAGVWSLPSDPKVETKRMQEVENKARSNSPTVVSDRTTPRGALVPPFRP